MPLTYAPCTVAVQVWAAADNKRQGFLDFNAFVKALELMSLAQVGVQAWAICCGLLLLHATG